MASIGFVMEKSMKRRQLPPDVVRQYKSAACPTPKKIQFSKFVEIFLNILSAKNYKSSICIKKVQENVFL
jgi:hypothetical protein